MSETQMLDRVDHQPIVRLLPCPFCGSPAKTYHDSVTCSNRECKMHFAAVPNMHTPEEWNRRDGCITCGAYELANEQLRKDVAGMHRRIKQLLENRGHVAAEAVMDKMAKEFQPNTPDQPR